MRLELIYREYRRPPEYDNEGEFTWHFEADPATDTVWPTHYSQQDENYKLTVSEVPTEIADDLRSRGFKLATK